MSNRAFFQDQTVALTASFVCFQFGFKADTWILINDDVYPSVNEIAYSFDGVNLHGIVKPGEAISNDTADVHAIYLKYITGAPAYRLMANGAF